MARLSIGRAWEEAAPFVRREGALLLPVALLFMALPTAILGQMLPTEVLDAMRGPVAARPALPASFLLALPIVLILTQTGALAVLALALRPGISVAEALHLAVRRMPALLVAIIVLGIAIGLAAFVLALVGAVAGLAIGAAAGGVLVVAFALPLIVYAAVRLLMLNPVLADEALGPVASIRRAWWLSAGHFWRLFAFLAVALVATQILAGAFGAIFGIVGGLIGGPDIANLMSTLAAAVVSAAAQTYMLVMMARILLQLR